MTPTLDATKIEATNTPMIDMIASTRRCDLARSLGLTRHCEREGPYIAKQIFFLVPVYATIVAVRPSGRPPRKTPAGTKPGRGLSR
jgi:hypothetical protein